MIIRFVRVLKFDALYYTAYYHRQLPNAIPMHNRSTIIQYGLDHVIPIAAPTEAQYHIYDKDGQSHPVLAPDNRYRSTLKISDTVYTKDQLYVSDSAMNDAVLALKIAHPRAVLQFVDYLQLHNESIPQRGYLPNDFTNP